jgi:hypothetical protein
MNSQKDFFISYNIVNRDWEWIAWPLKESRYTTSTQA